jgi:hypothetical protein
MGCFFFVALFEFPKLQIFLMILGNFLGFSPQDLNGDKEKYKEKGTSKTKKRSFITSRLDLYSQ